MTSLEADLLIAAVVACFILQTIALIMMLGKQKPWVPDMPAIPDPPPENNRESCLVLLTRKEAIDLDTMRRDSMTAYWLEIYEIGSDEMRLPVKLYWDESAASEACRACVSDEMFGHHTVRAVDVIRVSITRHPTVNGVEKE